MKTKKYIDLAHISYDNTNNDKFYQALNDNIANLQNKGLRVEVRYQMCALGASQVCYSALILGYKEV